MTREEQEHYEKLAEYYNAKQKPKTDTWSIKEVAKALEKHGFGRLEQEPKTEQEIREELNRLSTYRVPNSNTDLVSRKAVERVLNLVFRGCRDKEPKTDILDKIRTEIEQDAFKDVNGSKFIFVNRVNQIIDKYTDYPLGYNPWQE